MRYINTVNNNNNDLVNPYGRGHFGSITIATMTWLLVKEYLSHKWWQMYSICPNHNPLVFSFMTFHKVCYTTGATREAGTAYPSATPAFWVVVE
jgi:hypothetical protein